jgi:hypothetical protein
MGELGALDPLGWENFEGLGEQLLLPDEVIEQLLSRKNATLRYASVASVTLASFVRGVRQV